MSSLSKAISEVACHGFDIDNVVSYYEEWLSIAFRVVLVCLNSLTEDYEYYWFRSPKRGDWRYARRVSRRFDELISVIPKVSFFKYGVHGNVESSLVMLSLTYDRSAGLESAWLNIGSDLNRALSYLRKRFGHVSVARVWESHNDVFPHVHALILFHDRVFKGFSRKGRSGSLEYRTYDRDDIKKCWSHGYSDVLLMADSRSGFRYASKYLRKSVRLDGDHDSKAVKTLACCWFFRKRAFGLSGDWSSAYDSIVSVYSNSNREVPFWVCLDGSRLSCFPVKWSLFGFYKGDHVLLSGESGSLDRSGVNVLREDPNFRLARAPIGD